MPASELVPLPVARASFLRLMIPQLAANGFTELSARYAVELSQLEGRTVEDVYREFDECDRFGHELDADGTRCLFCKVAVELV